MLFQCISGHMNAPQCYMICTLPVLCFYAWRNKHNGIKCETRTYARLERRKTTVTGIIKDNTSASYAWIITWFLHELKKFWEDFMIRAFTSSCIMSQYLWVNISPVLTLLLRYFTSTFFLKKILMLKSTLF